MGPPTAVAGEDQDLDVDGRPDAVHHGPTALIALAVLTLGGLRAALPGR